MVQDSREGCCPQNAWGALDENMSEPYKPTGLTVKLCDGNLDAYVSKSQNKKIDKILLVIGDVYGWTNRVKSYCDSFANKGYFVIMPDLFHGETKVNNAEPTFLDWIKKFEYKKLKPEVDSCILYAKSILTDEMKISRIDGLGFCFGAWVFMKACCDLESNVSFTRVAVAHPSFYNESRAYGGDEVPLMKTALRNTDWLMLASKDEPDNCQANGEITDAINSTERGRAIAFTDMRHGWVARGDLDDPAVKVAARDALNKIDNFFS